jgi:hypothetical protein
MYDEYTGMMSILSDFGKDNLTDHLLSDDMADYKVRPPTFGETYIKND